MLIVVCQIFVSKMADVNTGICYHLKFLDQPFLTTKSKWLNKHISNFVSYLRVSIFFLLFLLKRCEGFVLKTMGNYSNCQLSLAHKKSNFMFWLSNPFYQHFLYNFYDMCVWTLCVPKCVDIITSLLYLIRHWFLVFFCFMVECFHELWNDDFNEMKKLFFTHFT